MNKFILKIIKVFIYQLFLNIFIKIRDQNYVLKTMWLSYMISKFYTEGIIMLVKGSVRVHFLHLKKSYRYRSDF